MASRVNFSGQQLGLADIDGYHHDAEAALRLYFSSASPTYTVRFMGYAVAEVTEELHVRLRESHLRASLTVLSSLEAAFRIDYLQRCYHRDRSEITRCFRDLYKEHAEHVRLDEHILDNWAVHFPESRALISEIKAAFRFRHWLAHGRYYTPKLGRKFDYFYLYELTDEVFNSFPFLAS
ncbi:MAG TPA: hypothetical protein VI653_28185 [Steroidobacteraceae bacterium]